VALITELCFQSLGPEHWIVVEISNYTRHVVAVMKAKLMEGSSHARRPGSMDAMDNDAHGYLAFRRTCFFDSARHAVWVLIGR
jgi:hypothetical protein